MKLVEIIREEKTYELYMCGYLVKQDKKYVVVADKKIVSGGKLYYVGKQTVATKSIKSIQVLEDNWK